MKRWILLFSLALGACGANTSTSPKDTAQTEAAVEPAVECLPGCRMQGDMCATEANVLEGVRETIRQVECDARCCEGAEPERPAADADGDGVPDDADQCPQEPEDRDAFQDDDGCPDPDNDGDGISDADDVCPLDKEDVDGFQDDDGCPD